MLAWGIQTKILKEEGEEPGEEQHHQAAVKVHKWEGELDIWCQEATTDQGEAARRSQARRWG